MKPAVLILLGAVVSAVGGFAGAPPVVILAGALLSAFGGFWGDKQRSLEQAEEKREQAELRRDIKQIVDRWVADGKLAPKEAQELERRLEATTQFQADLKATPMRKPLQR